MKRALLCLTVVGVAAVLAGCPIYSSQSDYRVCTGSACYDCPDPSYSGMCVPWSCGTDTDCPSDYTCSASGSCVPAGTGAASGDDASPTTDCSQTGCPAGQVCELVGGAASCVVLGGGSSSGGGTDAAALDATATGDSASGGGDGSPGALEASTGEGGESGALVSVEAGTDGSALPEASISVACNSNGDCSVGAFCIDGQCVPQAQLCSDGSQCAVSGESCVDGICVPPCSASAPCPAGYACDFSLGVCDINPGACTGGGTSSCQGSAVCVESHCVPPCSTGEGGAACPTGQVCVNGGCIPDQGAVFTCKNIGASGQLANSCDPSSVCVHHDCYTECDGDGGGCPAAQCKQVTVGANTYAICGTATTLGSDCDLAVGAACASPNVCVDGYCR
jgi:hypothetical protein